MFMIYVLSCMLESCMLGLILVMINLVRNFECTEGRVKRVMGVKIHVF